MTTLKTIKYTHGGKTLDKINKLWQTVRVSRTKEVTTNENDITRL